MNNTNINNYQDLMIDNLMNTIQQQVNNSSNNKTQNIQSNQQIPPELTNTLNEVGNMIDQLKQQKQIFCDKECQDNIKIENAYNEYLKAKELLDSTPRQLEEAEEAYFVLRDGPTAYMTRKKNNYINEAKDLGNLIREKINIMIQNLKPLINNIELQKKYSKKVDNLSDEIMEKLKNIKNKMDFENNEKNVANRKTIYYNQLTNFYSQINNFLFYFISILLIIYFVLILFGGVLFKTPYWIYILLFSFYYILPWSKLYLWVAQKLYEYTSFFR